MFVWNFNFNVHITKSSVTTIKEISYNEVSLYSATDYTITNLSDTFHYRIQFTGSFFRGQTSSNWKITIPIHAAQFSFNLTYKNANITNTEYFSLSNFYDSTVRPISGSLGNIDYITSCYVMSGALYYQNGKPSFISIFNFTTAITTESSIKQGSFYLSTIGDIRRFSIFPFNSITGNNSLQPKLLVQFEVLVDSPYLIQSLAITGYSSMLLTSFSLEFNISNIMYFNFTNVDDYKDMAIGFSLMDPKTLTDMKFDNVFFSIKYNRYQVMFVIPANTMPGFINSFSFFKREIEIYSSELPQSAQLNLISKSRYFSF
ncbi:hypothetical protein ACTA71_011465 [Dictyostelium dimigraforme]